MSDFEERSRELFRDSVDGLSMPLRSRLTQARYAAVEAAAAGRRRPWLLRMPTWAPVLGVSAAAVVGVALWFGVPFGSPYGSPFGLSSGSVAEGASQFEVLDIVASSDENSGDAIEMLQDDLDFYDYADKVANPPTA